VVRVAYCIYNSGHGEHLKVFLYNNRSHKLIAIVVCMTQIHHHFSPRPQPVPEWALFTGSSPKNGANETPLALYALS
jgi:hypothetical protein